MKEVSIPVALFVLPLTAFALVQYLRYGFGLFLGWDTPTYVWWAELVYVNGPVTLVHWAYPNLYTLILAGIGVLVGSASTGERILPTLAAAPMAYGYYRLSNEITSSKRLGYLGALVGGLTVTTLRLYSDLHRNLLSFGVCIVVGELISSKVSNANFSWRRNGRQAVLVWLPLLAVAAYTQIETYALLVLSLTCFLFWTRKTKTAVVGIILLVTPILVALPLIWPFLLSYAAGLQLLGQPTPGIIAILGDSLLYLGGLAFPWTVVGLWYTVRQARLGVPAARFMTLWILAGALLIPIGIPLGFPYYRFLYVLPVPAMVVAGVAWTLRNGSKGRKGSLLGQFFSFQIKVQVSKRSIVVPSVIVILLAATLITSTASDLFLRPYVSQTEVDRIVQAAQLAHQLGYSDPILIMYGPTAADLNPIYRAYFGIQIPNSLAYYGKLQYLFTLPEPGNVYKWQYDPPFEQASSLKYRSEIVGQLGNIANIRSSAVIIAGGKTYERPLSESFIQQFQTSPGTYIIPPGQLTPGQIDSWRFFAFSDWTSTTKATVSNATWSQSPQILDWMETGAHSIFEANYTSSLAYPWAKMSLIVRFYDFPQVYTFPDTSRITLAPLEVYFDGNLVLSHGYGGAGSSVINLNVTNVNTGLHQIRIRSESQSGVAVALDDIELSPA